MVALSGGLQVSGASGSPPEAGSYARTLHGLSVVLGSRVTDASGRRWDGRRSTRRAVGAVLSAPVVAFPAEAIGWLAEGGRFSSELLDPASGS
jgi:hypothetical protein